MNISQYDYTFPTSLITQFPAEKRSSSRLLVAEYDGNYRNLQFDKIIDGRIQLISATLGFIL